MPKPSLPMLGDYTEWHAAHPHMYPLPILDDLAVGDLVHCRAFRMSRKGNTIASAKLVIMIQMIAGTKLEGRVVDRFSTWRDQSLLQQEGDVLSFETCHIENVVGRESPLHNASDADGVHFRNFLVDERLIRQPGDVVKVVGGLPMPTDKMSPFDIETGNWTGLMMLGEGYQDGMPLAVVHGYALVLSLGAHGRDDSFMTFVAANDQATHERVDGVWRRAA